MHLCPPIMCNCKTNRYKKSLFVRIYMRGFARIMQCLWILFGFLLSIYICTSQAKLLFPDVIDDKYHMYGLESHLMCSEERPHVLRKDFNQIIEDKYVPSIGCSDEDIGVFYKFKSFLGTPLTLAKHCTTYDMYTKKVEGHLG